MSKSETYNSFAKINLRLKLLGRYPNGYHALDMLNCTVDLADVVTLELLDSPEIICDFKDSFHKPIEELNNASLNLTARAAKIILEQAKLTSTGVIITAIKNIPLGAGLGGGSSNTAVIIKHLPDLLLKFGYIDTDTHIDIKSTAHKIAYMLGTDIFYFLDNSGGISQVYGIGDKVEQLTAQSPISELILCLPSYSVNSSSVYSVCHEIYKELPALNEQAKPKGNLEASISTYESLFTLIDNDLIQPASVVQPKLLEDLNNLSRITDWKIGLSGSGSSIFLIPNSGSTKTLEIPPQIEKYAQEQAIKLINVKVLANFH